MNSIRSKSHYIFAIPVFISLIILMISLAMSSCSSNSTGGGNPKPGKFEEGWVDDNTYRFVVRGKAREGDVYPQDMTSACDAAIIMAQYAAVEKLADAGLKNVTGTVVVKTDKDVVIKEIQGFVRGGNAVDKRYDHEKKECLVAYEVQEKGLKRKVTAAARKSAGK